MQIKNVFLSAAESILFNLYISNWSLRKKLISTAIITASFILVVGAISHYKEKQIINSYESLLNKEFVIVNKLNDMIIKSKEVVIVITQITHSGKNPDTINELNTKYDNAVNDFTNIKRELKSLLAQQNQNEGMQAIDDSWKRLTQINDELISLFIQSANLDNMIRQIL